MSFPLATLRRHQTRVVLSDSSSRAGGGGGAPGRRMTRLGFADAADATSYLRFWKSDPGAMNDLRNALHRFLRTPTFRFAADDVIELLASQLARGRIMVLVESRSLRPSGRVVVPRGAGMTETPTVIGPLTPIAAATLPASLLPKLEEVQIEGATVLPEVLETLEQLELSMAQIDLATASLEPTPSGVPPIDQKLSAASDSIAATIDGL